MFVPPEVKEYLKKRYLVTQRVDSRKNNSTHEKMYKVLDKYKEGKLKDVKGEDVKSYRRAIETAFSDVINKNSKDVKK
jgi:hypothetical protein